MLLECEEIIDFPSIEAIFSEWAALWRASGQTPFQSPMWVIPWMRRFCGDNIAVLLVRSGGQLACVLPCYRWTEPNTNARKILLAGNGISDYLDACVHPDAHGEVVPILESWLRAQTDVDTCEFNQLPVHSVLRSASEEQGVACARLDLAAGLESIPKRQREKLHYYRNRISKAGDWHIVEATPETVPNHLERLMVLHEARWRERGAPGVLSGEAVREFHREAAGELSNAGCLNLYALKFKNDFIAALYAFSSAQATFFYLNGFDPAFQMFSPGTLLIGYAIDQAIERGKANFDFLRGQEPYKYSWGAIDHPTFRRVSFGKP